MTSHLPVVETFHSIQGEGNHAGRGAFFIRLASCKVGCSWCDTKESWDAKNHSDQSTKELAESTGQAIKNGASFVVITGGEPLHHNLNPLCNAIRNSHLNNGQERIPIHLETSGVNELTGNPNWITLSPKPHAPPKKELLISCHEIKVIVHSKEDIIFAEKIATLSEHLKSNNPYLYLQPGWDCIRGQNLTIEYIKHNPKWRLSLQTHKCLNIS